MLGELAILDAEDVDTDEGRCAESLGVAVGAVRDGEVAIGKHAMCFNGDAGVLERRDELDHRFSPRRDAGVVLDVVRSQDLPERVRSEVGEGRGKEAEGEFGGVLL